MLFRVLFKTTSFYAHIIKKLYSPTAPSKETIKQCFNNLTNELYESIL